MEEWPLSLPSQSIYTAGHMCRDMTGETMAQKLLAAHTESESVEPGEHVTVTPDWILAHDLSGHPSMRRMAQLGFEEIATPERVVVVFDHYVPSSNETISTYQNELETWLREQGVEHFYPPGRGISHNVISEEGYSLPGSLILGADSHTTTHGAFGAFATGVGHTDLGWLLGTGELWLKVPRSRRVTIDGSLPAGCAAKDLGLHILGELTTSGAIYESIEFHGDAFDGLAMHERQTLSNLAVELGAMAGLVPPDETTEAFVADRAQSSYEAVHPDDAAYVGEHRVDASALEPLVAAPSSVDNVEPVSAHAGVEVDQVFVGTCNNGSYEDVAAFAEMLSGEAVASGTDLVVVPGSRDALTRLNREGLSNEILEAGGMVGTPGCGPCFGAHGGILGEGDTCVGTMNRNFPGRMGPGEIYLASPQTAAAAAIYGEITDPREVV